MIKSGGRYGESETACFNEKSTKTQFCAAAPTQGRSVKYIRREQTPQNVFQGGQTLKKPQKPSKFHFCHFSRFSGGQGGQGAGFHAPEQHSTLPDHFKNTILRVCQYSTFARVTFPLITTVICFFFPFSRLTFLRFYER